MEVTNLDKGKLVIIKASEKDLSVLQDLSQTTFIESFGQANTKEDMDLYVAQTFNSEVLEKELQNMEIHYYLANLNNKAVAYFKLNFGSAQKERFGEKAVEIERLYVDKLYQNKKVGQRLIEKILALARVAGMKMVWLGVWENNPGAIRFYEQNGFIQFGSHSFLLGKDLQIDILMKLEL